MTEITALPAHVLRALIADRQLSPREVLSAYRARIDRLNPRLNALVAMCWDRAEAEASAAEAAVLRGDPLSPLHGLPLAVKESTDVEGLPTTQGSPIYAGRIATQDAGAVAALRRAGGIVVGKSNVPELLQGLTSRNSIYGLTLNAHDPRLSCLGSSGGSAVALSADMIPLATGSDMGGSIRGPSAANGTAGLRPSAGLIGREGAVLGFEVASVTGPMARDVRDLMLMTAGMIHEAPLDPLWWPVDPAPLLAPRAPDPATLRIAVSADLGCIEVNPAIRAHFERVIAGLAPHVGRVEWVTPDLGSILPAFYLLRTLAYMVSFGAIHDSTPERLTPQKNVDLRRGRAASASQIAEAQRAQTLAFQALAGLLRNFDLLITPGASQPLPSLEEIDRRDAALIADNARFGPTEYDFSRLPASNLNTPITWTAHPTVTIPAGRGPDGMPFGLNLIGRHRQDIRLLENALAIEEALGMPRPLPDLAAG